MNLLAVETSGFEASIALAMDGVVAETIPLPVAGRRHAQTLVAYADQLLNRHAILPSAIDIVAVSVGPGSFTGLRVGVVFAKTFAFANHASLVAVDTLQAIAQRSTSAKSPVCVISDAQRNEVFLNCYECRNGIFQPTSETEIVPVTEITSGRKHTLWSGPGVTKFKEHLQDCDIAEDNQRGPSADSVAVIGNHNADQNNFASIPALEPVYLRRSYAEENAARQTPS